MKRLTIIACCVVILAASYVFGAKTMTHTLEDIDAAITKFLTMDTAAELEATTQFFDGLIDKAFVYNEASGESEIEAICGTTRRSRPGAILLGW